MTNPMNNLLNDLEAILVLEMADDKLFLGHMQSDWTGLGPILEEDIASSSMAQDDLSHALVLYEYLGNRFGLDPDVIAYEREPGQYLCCDLMTVPDEFNWATSLVRRWLFTHYAAPVLDRLALFEDKELVERARKLRAEEALHVEYLDDWMRRLGSGSDEACDRIQKAIGLLSTHAGMLFELPGRELETDESFCCGRSELFEEWVENTNGVLEQAGLTMQVELPDMETVGGRSGVHADHFTATHAEMGAVRSADPGAAW